MYQHKMKILMCSYYKFPDGCAGSVRHEKLAQMLMSLEHEVLVVGTGLCNDFRVDLHKNIPYTSLRYGAEAKSDKVKTRLKYWANLKKILQEFKPSAIIMDDMWLYVTSKLKQYAKNHHILLIHDSVEWYSKEQFKYGAFSPAYIRKDLLNRVFIDKSFRVIGISQYLTDHFKKKNIPCVNIPIVVSDEDLVKEKQLNPKVNFVYAGQAGKKDYLDLVLEAITLLSDEERTKFTFNVLGCSEKQILDSGVCPSVLETVKQSTVFHGRVKREAVIQMLKTADFTILMRSPFLRYAKAGFPTKAVESLSHSTPLIANLTSDLHLYLEDGINSLVVEECTAQSLAEVLRKAIALPLSKREEMCKNAYTTAANKLHYKQFVPQIEEILTTGPQPSSLKSSCKRNEQRFTKLLSLSEIKQLEFDILRQFDEFCRKNNITYYLSHGTLLGAIKYKGFIPWDDDVDVLVPREDYDRLISIYPENEELQLLCDKRSKHYVLPFAKLSDQTTVITNQTSVKNCQYGVHIDIFPLDNWHEDLKTANKHARSLKAISKNFGMAIIPLNKGRTLLRSCVKTVWILFARLIGYKTFRSQLMNKIEKSLIQPGKKYCGCLVWPIYGKREVIPAEVFSNIIEVEFEGQTFPAPVGYDAYLRKLYGDYEKDPPLSKQVSHHNFEAYRL